jgi:hypothetical protein
MIFSAALGLSNYPRAIEGSDHRMVTGLIPQRPFGGE